MADRDSYATKQDLKKLRQEMKDDLKETFGSFKAEIVHQFGIISEHLGTQIKQVAEGVTNVYEKAERLEAELKGEIHEVRQDILNLYVKTEKDKAELKSEIQETRQEVLAAIKFSYAELDRRLTTLETEFLDLRRRVKKIESRSIS